MQVLPNHLGQSVGSVVAHLSNMKINGNQLLDKEDDYYRISVVSLEERIPTGGEQDGDEVVLENQHRGREVHHLEENWVKVLCLTKYLLIKSKLVLRLFLPIFFWNSIRVDLIFLENIS